MATEATVESGNRLAGFVRVCLAPETQGGESKEAPISPFVLVYWRSELHRVWQQLTPEEKEILTGLALFISNLPKPYTEDPVLLAFFEERERLANEVLRHSEGAEISQA